MKPLRLTSRRSPAVRVLADDELPAALALCAQDPVASVLAASRIEASIADPLQRSTGQVWGFPGTGPLEAICWAGANLVPVVPDPAADILDAFAHQARVQGRQCSSIAGPAEAVLGLWRRLEHAWSVPRDVRPNQPSLQIIGDPLIEPDPGVRHATLDDLDDLVPACVAMFEEEVGYSPIAFSGRAYTQRVRSLVTDRRSFIARASRPVPGPAPRAGEGDGARAGTGSWSRAWSEAAPGGGRGAGQMLGQVSGQATGQGAGQDAGRGGRTTTGATGEIIFKAELGAVTSAVAQVQGVWVDPRHRGRGHSEPGMAAVVVAARREVAGIVSLYANAYNARALAAYRRVGFEQVGTFATVLF